MKRKSPIKETLAVRLSGYAAATGALLALSPAVKGQVVYSGAQNLELNLPEESLAIDLDGDMIDDFNFLVFGYTYFVSSGPFYYNMELRYAGILNPKTDSYNNSWITKMSNVRTVSTYYGATSQYQAPVVDGLGAGEPVDSLRDSWANLQSMSWSAALGGTYNVTYYGFYGLYSSGWAAGDFRGEEKYIGVRFYTGPEQHYGWIRVSLGDEIEPLTIIDWAYEQVPGKPILAGDGLGIDLPAYLRITGGGGGSAEATRTITLTATEEVTGMEESDIIATNGTLANYTEVTPGLLYTVDVTALSEGQVIVEIPAGAVTDTADNANAAVSASWYYDLTGPVAEVNLYTSNPSSSPWADGYIEFNEKVYGLDSADLNVKNGVVNYFDADFSGKEFSFEIYADAEGEISVEIPAGAGVDVAGNGTEKILISWVYDATGPIATLDAGLTETAEATIEIDINFNEPVIDLQLEDFMITNGNADLLQTISQGLHYKLTVTADAPGIVVVSLREYSIYDAAYNSNMSASTGWMYDPLGLNSNGELGIILYPNPVSDFLHIENVGKATVKMIDLSGNLVYLKESTGEELMIDVNGFTPGVYIIQIQDRDKLARYKVIIE
jgi:hypothetical protein